jgi:CheY-like chemotaxis protein
MSREHGVRRYAMYNEPNHSNKIKEEKWLDLLLVCSDAIQSAIQDMNARYGRSLKPEIFAPNTAGGASKYNDEAQGRWGNTTIANRHRRLDGSIDPKWMNIHVYNYQKYSHRQADQDRYSGFLTDYKSLRGLIDAATQGEPRLPLSLTEFNVRTAANYDETEDTLDSPPDFTSLGATLAGLSASGMQQMYLFKFGQTAWKSTHGVKKNGTHFVQNSAPYNYGGATRAAEVFRLFIKAARGARPIHRVTASAGASPGLNNGLWHLATRDMLKALRAADDTAKPDVMLMDVGLPSRSGLEVLADVIALAPECRVVILTVFEDEKKISDAISAGACG